MISITANDAPEAWSEIRWRLRADSVRLESRNGPVIAFPDAVNLTITNPKRRIIDDPVRDANPFFHVMEFVWMMAGSNDLRWLSKFNSNMMSYSDDGHTQHAAYGHRWRRHFGCDQIARLVWQLRKDPNDRRAVLGMWDPRVDFGTGKDYPCNTHIYFRVADRRLNMYVCNRSNDIVWGMLGANVVHMTLLQQLISEAVGIPLGAYNVYSVNAHMYLSTPRYTELMTEIDDSSFYTRDVFTANLLEEPELITDFLEAAYRLVNYGGSSSGVPWIDRVAVPMYRAYMERRDKRGDGMQYIQRMPETLDWRIVCEQWISRRPLDSTQTASPSSDTTLGDSCSQSQLEGTQQKLL